MQHRPIQPVRGGRKVLNDVETGGVSTVLPFKRLNYPNLERPVYRGSLLRQPNPRL